MKKSKNIYLDYASATPLDSGVLKLMNKIGAQYFANPSSIHDLGMASKKIIDESRVQIAKILSAHADEIVFTSGATESNNLAIKGVVVLKNFPHIVTTNIEHASVLEVYKNLEENKLAEVTFVEVEPNGIVDPKKIKKALQKNTVLVSVMYANNEIGTIQPIREIAKEIRHFNKLNSVKVLFHTDATQAMNYLDINLEKLGVDLLSFNAGKIYGPKGIGVLYIKRKTPITAVTKGGDQEFHYRAGTENIVSIVGLKEALTIIEKIKEKEIKRVKKLQEYFFSKLLKIDSVILNGNRENRLPNNINITIPKIPSDLLVIELSARGIMVSAKSACKSGEVGGSHVLAAINPKASQEDGSLRFSLGRATTKQDIDYTLKSLSQILTKLKKWYT